MNTTKPNCFKFQLPNPFVLLFMVLSAYALDLESAKEQNCLPIKKTTNVDIQWLMSVKEWYYPLMSRLDLYRSSSELIGSTEDISNLKESEVYYDSCIKVRFIENIPYVTGFNGKQTKLTMGLPTISEEGVASQKFTTESRDIGVSYITLTDNATYVFVAACFDDDQATWGISSTVAELPEETTKLIYNHAESLGFKREYFEELRYDFCDGEQRNKISVEKSETCSKI